MSHLPRVSSSIKWDNRTIELKLAEGVKDSGKDPSDSMSCLSVGGLYFLPAIEGVSHGRGPRWFSMVVEPQPGINAFKSAGCPVGGGRPRHDVRAVGEIFPLFRGSVLPRTLGACQRDG